MTISWVLPTREQVHYSPPEGFDLLWMTPAKFLELAPPLRLPDPESNGYILHFVEKLQNNEPLDPPELALDHHDGRHRVTAALIAGLEEIPVMVSQPFYDFLIEMEFAHA